jgi:hypothetical protein
VEVAIGRLATSPLRVAKCTIQRHIRAIRPPGGGQRWRSFLKNHTVWACDLLQTYDNQHSLTNAQTGACQLSLPLAYA